MNALDYYIGLNEKDKGLARGREGRRQFLEMGMDKVAAETWALLRGEATPDMAMFALPNGAGVKDSCFRAMVSRLADGKNLFVNTSGDRVMVNAYSPNFAQLLNAIDDWLEDGAVLAIYRRFGLRYETGYIEIALNDLPEEVAFFQDIASAMGVGDVQGFGGDGFGGELRIRFVDEDTADWTNAAAAFTSMYEKFLTDGFYSAKTLEIERGKIEREIVNEFCGRASGYVYADTGTGIDSFLNSFFGKTLYEYIKELADFEFEWQLGKHLPEVSALDPLFDGGLRMSVNPSDDEDVAARAKEIAAAVIELYNKHWSGEISLPAYSQPRLGLGV